MAFIVETGAGVVDANSLCSVADADAYFADRGVATWTGTTAAKEQALVRATDYVCSRWDGRWRGQPVDEAQSLPFPRTDIGYDLTVPRGIVRAVAEYALRALGGTALAPDPTVDASGMVVKSTKSRVEGAVSEEIEYAGAQRLLPAYPAADMLVRPFLVSRGGVVRA